MICTYTVQATHLRAGEITAVKTGPLTYDFTFVLYRNITGVDQPNCTFNFGDGTTRVVDVSSRNPPGANSQNPLDARTEKLTFVTTHTYNAPSTYTVSVREVNRNGGIANMAASENVAFYIETQITIDPFLGANNSPLFLVPPIDIGAVNRIYTHTPGAFDPDGDSLSYRLITPKSDKDIEVPGFVNPADRFPGTSSTGGRAFLSMNPRTGLITWDSPAQPGLYNIAFMVEEWRGGVRLGYIVRDMQIEIINTANQPPLLAIPRDTCITAGAILRDTARATDAAFTPLRLTASSGAFSLGVNSLRALPNDTVQGITPVSMALEWQTNCALVRNQPYQITFKAQDNLTELNSLSTLKIWQVRIIPPKVENFTAIGTDKSVQLTWNLYNCGLADSLFIYRRACSSDTTFINDSCATAQITPQGFILVGRVPVSATSFIDSIGLNYGVKYCYYIYANFPEPAKGYSRYSSVQCAQLVPIYGLPLQATVIKTDSLNGSVNITWFKPTFSSANLSRPVTLKLYRNNTPNAANLLFETTNFADTVYTDANINTLKQPHAYFYQITDANGRIIAASDTFTTVYLQGIGRDRRAVLIWQSKTPWENYMYYIYRVFNGDTTLVDSTTATNFVDAGSAGNPLMPNTAYFYYIKSKGAYGCRLLPFPLNNTPKPLTNVSNTLAITVLDSLSDTLAPCPPVLSIARFDCEANRANTLFWKKTLNITCDSSVASYRLYKSQPGSITNFELYESTADTAFAGRPGKPVIDCFYVTALNTKGIESLPSNTVCSDSCFFFELPNIFTPNGDNINDTFSPKPEPKYVSNVDLKIYNRWGVKVYESNGKVNFSWDAMQVPDGIYFYIATITVALPASPAFERNIKGWVQILR